jgi:hypothetical protein
MALYVEAHGTSFGSAGYRDPDVFLNSGGSSGGIKKIVLRGSTRRAAAELLLFARLFSRCRQPEAGLKRYRGRVVNIREIEVPRFLIGVTRNVQVTSNRPWWAAVALRLRGAGRVRSSFGTRRQFSSVRFRPRLGRRLLG